jgi:DNA polymerase III delta prime subunit
MIENIKQLWTEKYRPKTINDLVASPSTLNLLNKFKDEQSIPNLLLTGPAGIGKTSISKIIVNDILKCDYIYINASDENGIDTIRNKVIGFAQTASFTGSIKVVILDEGDGLTGDSQRALRNTMEEYSNVTRFILTANYKYKIIPALQSRCQSLSFNYDLKDVVRRCFDILKAENVFLHKDQKELFLNLIKTHFPDLRKVINEMQKYCINNELRIGASSQIEEFVIQLFNKIKSESINNCRKFVIENETVFSGDYHNLMKCLLECIYSSNINNKQILILTLTEHMYRCSFCIDQEINCFACIINLQQAINSSCS